MYSAKIQTTDLPVLKILILMEISLHTKTKMICEMFQLFQL